MNELPEILRQPFNEFWQSNYKVVMHQSINGRKELTNFATIIFKGQKLTSVPNEVVILMEAERKFKTVAMQAFADGQKHQLFLHLKDKTFKEFM